MQIKGTIRYHLTLTRVTMIRKTGYITSVSKDVETLEPSYVSGEIIR